MMLPESLYATRPIIRQLSYTANSRDFTTAGVTVSLRRGRKRRQMVLAKTKDAVGSHSCMQYAMQSYFCCVPCSFANGLIAWESNIA